MNVIPLPTPSPALATPAHAATATKPPNPPGTPAADPAESFARELDRAGVQRPGAAPSRGADRERPTRAAAPRAAHPVASRPAEYAGRAAGAGRRAVERPEVDSEAVAVPDGGAGQPAPDEPVDIAALIAAGRDVDSRADVADLPPAAAFGQAVAAVAHDQQAPAAAAGRAAPGQVIASATPSRSVADADSGRAGSDTFGRSVAQLAHDRNTTGEEAAPAGPFGQTIAPLAREHHAAQARTTGAGADSPPTAHPLGPPAGSESTAPQAAADAAAAASAAARSAASAVATSEAPGSDSGSAVPQAPVAAGAAAAPGLAHRPDAAGVSAQRHAELAEPVGSPRFAPALGARVVTLVRDGVEQAQVRLNPAELGPIAVHIRVDGTRAEVEFSAAHALTRQALQDAVPALAGALRESGLTLAGGGVFEQPRESRDADAAPRGEPGARSGPHGSAESPTAVPARARARGIVDLFA